MGTAHQSISEGTDGEQLSNRDYSQLVNSFAQAVWQTDAQGMVVEDSPSWRVYTGQTLQQWLGEGWLKAVHPDDRRYARQQWQQAIETQTPLNAEFRLQSPDGNWRWTSVMSTAIRNLDGAITKWVGINVDITERKAQQTYLLKLSDELRLLPDPIDIQGRAAQLLGEYLGSDRAYYVEVQEATHEFVVARDWHQPDSPSHARRDPLGDWPIPWLLDGKTWVVRDTTTDPTMPDDQRASYLRNDIGAAVVVPLIKQGHLVATFVTNQRTPRSWTSTHVSLIEETAERTWAAVERARAEEALQKSEEKYRTLFDSIDEGFVIIDVLFDEADKAIDYRFVDMNRSHEEVSGVPRTVIGKRVREVMPTIEENVLERAGNVALTGEPIRYEVFVSALGRWFNVYTSRIGGNDSRLVANVFTNITERKRYEANLAFLAETSADFSPLANAGEIMQRVADRLADYLQLSRCHFTVIDQEADHIEVIYDWRRDETMPGLLGVHRLSEYITEDARQQYSTGKLSVVSGLDNDPSVVTSIDLLKPLGFGSLMDVPYLQNGRWMFMLTVGRLEAGDWRTDEQELVRELAARIYLRLERARTEEAMRQSEEQFRLYLTATSDILYRMNADWTVMHSLVGKTFLANTDSPSGNWLNQYLPEKAKAQAHTVFQAAIREKKIFELEHQVVRADGTLGWTFSRAIPLLNQQGEIMEWFGAASDITERKEAEEALVEEDRRKDEFLALLAHELRNPMATLSNTLLILELTGGQDESMPLELALSMMRREVAQLVRLVDDLMDVSRINQNRITLRLEPLNLVELIDKAIDATSPLIKAAHRQLSVHLPTEPLYLQGDAVRLTQVVRNLLSNATKFTQEGGHIWVSLERQGDEAILQVRDDGIGIPADQLGRIFGLFAQVDSSSTRSQGGLGLGLTLVNEFIERHGGRVEARSTGPDRGSEFIVYLPISTFKSNESIH